MKDIHDAKFKFVPFLCTEPLHGMLLAPVPAHMLKVLDGDGGDANAADPVARPRPVDLKGDLTLLPPPVSHLLGDSAEARLSKKGKSILCAIKAPSPLGGAQCLTSRERILRALTDDAYA